MKEREQVIQEQLIPNLDGTPEDDDKVEQVSLLLLLLLGSADAEILLTEMTARLNGRHREETEKQFSKVIGADLPQGEPEVQDHVSNYPRLMAPALVALFALDDIRRIVAKGVVYNRNVLQEIKEALKKDRVKASLLVREQVGTLHGTLTKIRQQSLGVEEYMWKTKEDERVRPVHRALHDTIQRWDEPPLVNPRANLYGHPGDDYNCRCGAIPIIKRSK